MDATPDARFDVASASVARVYDYLLGSRGNFDVDRQFADSLVARDPQLSTTARLNKDFGRRATDYPARQGIRQFLDLGSGIPTSPPSTHDTARRIDPSCNVVYIDHDPVVAAHNRALRAAGPGLSVEPGLVDYRDWQPSANAGAARPHLNIPLVAAVGRLA